MAINKQWIYYILIGMACTSCRSSRSMQNELNGMRSDLYYELTSVEYLNEVNKTVYLEFIDYSNTDYHTTIQRKGGFFLPLLLYNYERNNYRTRLGEHSLSQLYREFLTDALLAECNSSTCFQLLHDPDQREVADSIYRLEVKILQNETTGGVVLTKNHLIGLDGEYISFQSSRYRPAHSQLQIAVRLSYQTTCLLNKTYQVQHKQSRKSRSYETSYDANQACLNDMAESLSLATKEIVEEISQELHLLMSAQ